MPVIGVITAVAAANVTQEIINLGGDVQGFVDRAEKQAQDFARDQWNNHLTDSQKIALTGGTDAYKASAKQFKMLEIG